VSLPRWPWVKICGVRRPEDGELAARLGATMIGLNFWPRSRRRVERSAAREIAAAIEGRALRVGVFVDEEVGRIEATIAEVGLDLVQLHGDEPEAVVARFGARAIRVRRSAAPLDAGAAAVFAYLLDAPARPGPTPEPGGTGRSWDWSLAGPFVAGCGAPVLIAGGVTAANAARALAESGAAGVDVASGVESAPGVKDPEKMERLFEEVRGVRR
jgi:phosphoribosylanthranilate isomerase